MSALGRGNVAAAPTSSEVQYTMTLIDESLSLSATSVLTGIFRSKGLLDPSPGFEVSYTYVREINDGIFGGYIGA